jgi:hypothetical protein
MFAIFRAASEEEKQAKAQEWVSTVEKEIEPLLVDADPFFGGSKELTLAEVCIHLVQEGFSDILMDICTGQHRTLPSTYFCPLGRRRPTTFC